MQQRTALLALLALKFAQLDIIALGNVPRQLFAQEVISAQSLKTSHCHALKRIIVLRVHPIRQFAPRVSSVAQEQQTHKYVPQAIIVLIAPSPQSVVIQEHTVPAARSIRPCAPLAIMAI